MTVHYRHPEKPMVSMNDNELPIGVPTLCGDYIRCVADDVFYHQAAERWGDVGFTYMGRSTKPNCIACVLLLFEHESRKDDNAAK